MCHSARPSSTKLSFCPAFFNKAVIDIVSFCAAFFSKAVIDIVSFCAAFLYKAVILPSLPAHFAVIKHPESSTL